MFSTFYISLTFIDQLHYIHIYVCLCFILDLSQRQNQFRFKRLSGFSFVKPWQVVEADSDLAAFPRHNWIRWYAIDLPGQHL